LNGAKYNRDLNRLDVFERTVDSGSYRIRKVIRIRVRVFFPGVFRIKLLPEYPFNSL
jgi:hypothetical protein